MAQKKGSTLKNQSTRMPPTKMKNGSQKTLKTPQITLENLKKP
jgi:hypothetical protein